jgi:hypothetical protein
MAGVTTAMSERESKQGSKLIPIPRAHFGGTRFRTSPDLQKQVPPGVTSDLRK